MADDRFLLRGVVCDEKPAGLYVKTDPDPLWLHHMIVEMEVVYPTFVIERAYAKFHEHPHLGCTGIPITTKNWKACQLRVVSMPR